MLLANELAHQCPSQKLIVHREDVRKLAEMGLLKDKALREFGKVDV